MNTHLENKEQPLAARMRPRNLAEFIGQSHILGPQKPLRLAIERGRLHSMIFWGPPGVGKTTLARLIASVVSARFETLSAVTAGVKDIRAVVETAKQYLPDHRTVLFVDEVHRFSKSQQDVLLPFVEDGTLTLIGATTENPSFELNNALRSRARIYVLKSLTPDDLQQIIQQALQDSARGVADYVTDFPAELQTQLIQMADGDARRLLNTLEIIAELAAAEGLQTVTPDMIEMACSEGTRRFDKGGDLFYEQISALHKAVRGSSPDASLYWLARMLDGGCDPLYIARRVVRMAIEDIGNADPRALELALNAWDVQERLGSPEGELAIAQAVTYIACAAKSNAVYVAFDAAKADARQQGSLGVPLHLRNAPTSLLKGLDYGKHYRYAHDEPHAYAAGVCYFPEKLANRRYYFPTPRGLEAKIAEKLDYLRNLDAAAKPK
jgi:putative ATPase